MSYKTIPIQKIINRNTITIIVESPRDDCNIITNSPTNLVVKVQNKKFLFVPERPVIDTNIPHQTGNNIHFIPNREKKLKMFEFEVPVKFEKKLQIVIESPMETTKPQSRKLQNKQFLFVLEF